MLSTLSRPQKRFISFIGCCLFIIIYLYLNKISSTLEFTSQEGNHWGSANGEATIPECDFLEGLDDVFVVVKTGANEAHEKLPIHFKTTLSCIPHYGIWSDLEEDIAGHHVSDALDNTDPNIVSSNPDFEYYRQLRENGTGAFTPEQLTAWAEAQNTNSGRDAPGWKLDKWKFLPLAEKAYRQRPEARWFVLMECDTFIIWRNLLAWLSTLDSSEPLYLGHQMQIGDVTFAYGGAGIIISNLAMQKLVDNYSTNRAFYDDYTAHHWAGDCVLGKAMADAGVNLKWSWPTLLGDLIADVDLKSTFGSPSAKPWCYHATSYHHLKPSDIAQYDSFEKTWRKEVRQLETHFPLPPSPTVTANTVMWNLFSFISFPIIWLYELTIPPKFK